MKFKSIVSRNKNVIKWRMTEWCNYRCSYCIRRQRNAHLKAPEHSSEELVQEAKRLNEYFDRFDENDKWSIDLIGGEVSFFDLPAIINEFKSKNIEKVHITTNFSKSAEFYNKVYDILHERGIIFSMNTSLHDDYVKDVDKFIKKFIDLKLEKKKLEFVVTDKNQDVYQKLLKAKEEHNLHINFDVCVGLDGNIDLGDKNIDDKADNKKNYKVVFKDGHEEMMSRDDVCTYDKKKGDTFGYVADGQICFKRGLYLDPYGNLSQYSCRVGKKIIANLLKDDVKDVKMVPVLCTRKTGCALCGNIHIYDTTEEFKKSEDYKVSLK